LFDKEKYAKKDNTNLYGYMDDELGGTNERHRELRLCSSKVLLKIFDKKNLLKKFFQDLVIVTLETEKVAYDKILNVIEKFRAQKDYFDKEVFRDEKSIAYFKELKVEMLRESFESFQESCPNLGALELIQNPAMVQ
jgi:hypothetical protein